MYLKDGLGREQEDAIVCMKNMSSIDVWNDNERN